MGIEIVIFVDQSSDAHVGWLATHEIDKHTQLLFTTNW